MKCYCDECRKETVVLYHYRFFDYCRKCLESMYDVIECWDECFVCDECGQECNKLYRDGETGFCEDCLFDSVTKSEE